MDGPEQCCVDRDFHRLEVHPWFSSLRGLVRRHQPGHWDFLVNDLNGIVFPTMEWKCATDHRVCVKVKKWKRWIIQLYNSTITYFNSCKHWTLTQTNNMSDMTYRSATDVDDPRSSWVLIIIQSSMSPIPPTSGTPPERSNSWSSSHQASRSFSAVRLGNSGIVHAGFVFTFIPMKRRVGWDTYLSVGPVCWIHRVLRSPAGLIVCATWWSRGTRFLLSRPTDLAHMKTPHILPYDSAIYEALVIPREKMVHRKLHLHRKLLHKFPHRLLHPWLGIILCV